MYTVVCSSQYSSERERERVKKNIVIGGVKRKRDRGKQKFLSAMTLLYKVNLPC